MTSCAAQNADAVEVADDRVEEVVVAQAIGRVAAAHGRLGDERRCPWPDHVRAEEAHVADPVRQHRGVGNVDRALVHQRLVVHGDEREPQGVVAQSVHRRDDIGRHVIETANGLVNRERDHEVVELPGRPTRDRPSSRSRCSRIDRIGLPQ